MLTGRQLKKSFSKKLFCTEAFLSSSCVSCMLFDDCPCSGLSLKRRSPWLCTAWQ